MRTKNAARITADESAHMARVKSVACVVCGADAPVEAHHIKQGRHYCTVATCADCHRGSENGWHGRKTMWRVMKMDELDALNKTLAAVEAAREAA